MTTHHKMRTFHGVAIFVLAALVAGIPLTCPPTTVIVIIEGHSNLDTEQVVVEEILNSSATTLLPAHTLDPNTLIITETVKASTLSASQESNAALITDAGNIKTTMSEDYMTISITNSYKANVSLSLGSNVGSPSAIGDPAAALFPEASLTQYTFPTGWAGRIYVGPNTNPDGSKIEGSFTGQPDIDVSYVDGYSVPITCSSEGVPVTGCNIDLFSQENNSCITRVAGPICLNPAQDNPQGPAPPFFAACAGAAYTYPKDDGANQANLLSNLVSCCIGTPCAAPARQKGTLKIRDDV